MQVESESLTFKLNMAFNKSVLTTTQGHNQMLDYLINKISYFNSSGLKDDCDNFEIQEKIIEDAGILECLYNGSLDQHAPLNQSVTVNPKTNGMIKKGPKYDYADETIWKISLIHKLKESSIEMEFFQVGSQDPDFFLSSFNFENCGVKRIFTNTEVKVDCYRMIYPEEGIS